MSADASGRTPHPGDDDRPAVWIFGDLPLRTACGPSYMVESWQRELAALGWAPRLFTPSGSRRSDRTPGSVTFRTWQDVGFPGDQHARVSYVAQLWRARRELPAAVLSTTPGRVGLLGVAIAAWYRVPLVVVESTDVTGAMAHFGAVRMLASGGVKPLVALAVARRFRSTLLHGLLRAGRHLADRAWLAQLYATAVRREAAAVVRLSDPQRAGARLPGTRLPDAGRPEDLGAVRCAVIPSGIDRLPSVPPPADLRWPPGRLRVLYVGRLSPEKSLLLLVHAVRHAADDGTDVHLAVVGGGPLAADVVALAERLGVRDRVSVLGPYPRTALGGVYADAHVFAFPSVVETQAFVLNEAAHDGLPLLVSDDSMNPVVVAGRSALVVDHDPAAYARAFAALRDAGLRARLGGAARVLAGECTEAGQAARLSAVLHEVVGTCAGLVPVGGVVLPRPVPVAEVIRRPG